VDPTGDKLTDTFEDLVYFARDGRKRHELQKLSVVSPDSGSAS
jgi:hypothetical protein